MSDKSDRNKRTAQAFYDLMFNQCKPREAIEFKTGAGRRKTVSAWRHSERCLLFDGLLIQGLVDQQTRILGGRATCGVFDNKSPALYESPYRVTASEVVSQYSLF